jgi:uncharacterized protein YbcI
MPGFEFRYRLNGRAPTIERFAFSDGETLARGDVISVENGCARLGATGDTQLVGVVQEPSDGTARVRVMIDADAVYGISDPIARHKGASLDLSGPTGAQTVGASVNADFLVDVDSRAEEETLVRINAGRRDDTTVEEERPAGGELNAAIARAVVRHHSELLGRGPTKAHAFYRDNIVVVVLEEVMTQSERNLVAAGQREAVLRSKEAVQVAMRPYYRSMIERLTGCTMLAFMSANHLDPDIAAELFILDRPIS